MANTFDMDWGDVASGNSVGFFQLDTGKAGNRCRIVSNPSQLWVHWEKNGDGKNVKILCTGASCPICAVEQREGTGDHKAKPRFNLLVLNKKEYDAASGKYINGAKPKVEVLDVGNQVIKQIKEFATNQMYGSPTQYDIIIKKEGQGRDTKYTVVPDPNKTPLTAEEKEALKDVPSIKDMNQERTPEEIKAMNLLCLGGKPTTSDEGVPVGGGNKPESSWDVF